MDSLSIAWWKRPDLAITINYGQLAAKAEILASQTVCAELNIEHIVIDLDCRALGSGDMARNNANVNAPASDWWPYHNQLLITLAAMKAISLNVTHLWIETVKSDGIHLDGTPNFVASICKLLIEQDGAMQVEAPAIEMSTGELVRIADRALLSDGFPPSFWSGSPAEIGAEMKAVGAHQADFIVAQTSDRDAGCMEVASPPAECAGRTGSFYWDENNIATPNFHQSQSAISDYRAVLSNGLPILWWQTPMSVPSATTGCTNQHYRYNRVDYMLRNPQEYGDIHTFAIVFRAGGAFQTTINTDGGQFARLLSQYFTQGGATLR
ncbi:7-cyano-7-deazaguanine synthase [Collimonas pratensis]|uniref:ExsB family protein n=1 Tax=Collimonas pratensis TaxID=279113 RepID=A0A127QAK9_9BURK|nr:7-cyano-7-deazaguanine synthase [Collimonas pratensis]AMP07046.1 exsB family protein [Collimonas pratensis]